MISLMFAINWIYWKVELSQHVNMKHKDKFYWYVCDNRFLITPVANVLIWAVKAKELRILEGQQI